MQRYSLFLCLLFWGFATLLSQGQECTAVLRVQDASDGTPLAFATVTYRSSGGNMQGGFTDIEGVFRCKLTDTASVVFKITYMGYEPYEVSILCSSEVHRIPLQRSSFQLKEVIVTERLPEIIEKKDTVVYDVKQFVNGQEWKLREILAKLPGIEVTQDNQVLYKGEHVKEVLVEGQTFFTGDAALAVRYIPADAVEKVQVLEKYNEMASLQGSGINDRLALNIQLKPERKKLLFGDIRAGTNVRERHTLHSNLFRYLPRTSINHIGDFNTTEQVALTGAEMIRLVGFKLNGYDPRGKIADGTLEQLASLTAPERIFDRQSLFTINQIRQQLPKSTSLNAILMWTNTKVLNNINSTTEYLPTYAREITQSASEKATESLMAKVTLATDNSKPNHVSHEFHLTRRALNHAVGADVVFNNRNSRSAELKDDSDFAIQNEITAILKLNDRWQSILQARIQHNRESSAVTWDVAGAWRPTFYISDADTFRLNQHVSGNTNEYTLLWRLNHTLGRQSRAYFFAKQNYRTDWTDTDASFTSPVEAPRSLFPLGVGYSQRLESSELSVGGRFLLKKQDFELQLGMDYLAPQWNDRTLQKERRVERSPAPVVELSGLIRRLGKLRFTYGYNIIVPRHTHLFEGMRLQYFNRLLQGAPDLIASRVHHTALHFSRSNLTRGQMMAVSMIYAHTQNPILTTYLPSQNALLQASFNGLHSKEDFIASLVMQRQKRTFRITNRVRFMYFRFYQEPPWTNAQLFQQRTLSNVLTLAREWKQTTLDVKHTIDIGHFPASEATLDWYLNNRLSTSLQQRFGKQWKADLGLDFNHINTKEIRSANTNISCSLQYTTLKRKYIIEFRAHNLLDQRFIADVHADAFMTRNTEHLTMPRFGMLSVTRVF